MRRRFAFAGLLALAVLGIGAATAPAGDDRAAAPAGRPRRRVAHRGAAPDRARRRVLVRQLELARGADSPRRALRRVPVREPDLHAGAVAGTARAKAGGVRDQLARRHRPALEPGEDQDGVRPREASEAAARRRGAEGSDRPLHARGAQAPGPAPGAEEDREPRARREGHRRQGRARPGRCRLRLSAPTSRRWPSARGRSRYPHEPSRRWSTSSRSPRSPSTPRQHRTSSSPFFSPTGGDWWLWLPFVSSSASSRRPAVADRGHVPGSTARSGERCRGMDPFQARYRATHAAGLRAAL